MNGFVIIHQTWPTCYKIEKLARELGESQVKGTTVPYEYTQEDQRELKTAIDCWIVMINKLQKEHDYLSAIVSLKKNVAQLLKVVTEIRSKRELHKSSIRNQLEAILLLYKVQQAS